MNRVSGGRGVSVKGGGDRRQLLWLLSIWSGGRILILEYFEGFGLMEYSLFGFNVILWLRSARVFVSI
jgi:hypothetical protein